MRYIIFDLEATCWEGHLLGRVQEIIEIGAIMTDPFGNELKEFQCFVRPVLNPTLSVYCKNLTSIEQEEVDAADPFDRAARRFMEWIDIYGEPYMLCSWGSKDIELLKDDCARSDVESDWLESYIDIKSQYHHMKGAPKKRGLKRVLADEGFEFEGRQHRAMDDAANLFMLFKRYRDMWMH